MRRRGPAAKAGVFADIDRLLNRHREEMAEVERALRDARATCLIIMETGIWKCRVRVFRQEAREWVRGWSAAELLAKVAAARKLYDEAKETARKEREEEREARKEEVRQQKEALRALGATRVSVRRSGLPPPAPLRVWRCAPRRGEELLEASTAEDLIERVKALRQIGAE